VWPWKKGWKKKGAGLSKPVNAASFGKRGCSKGKGGSIGVRRKGGESRYAAVTSKRRRV